MTRSILLKTSAALLVSLGLVLPAMAVADDAKSTPVTASNLAVAIHPDVQLTQGDVRAALMGARPEQRAAIQEAPGPAEALATDLMIRRLIAAQARKEGLDREPTTALRLKLAEEKALFEFYIEHVEARAVDEKTVESLARDEYRAFPERYRKEERHARHILVQQRSSCERDPRSTAESLLARIKAGEAFEDIARKHSDDAGTAAKGGDLGWVEKGKTVPAFEAALFALSAPGELSGIVESPFGFHIIQLVERKAAALPPFDEVKGPLTEAVRGKLKLQARRSLIEPMIAADKLKLDRDALGSAVDATWPR